MVHPLVKLVLAGINALCLILTLLSPSNLVPLAVVPAIVTSSVWIIDSTIRKGITPGNFILTVCAVITGMICFGVNFMAEIRPNHMIVFERSLYLLGGVQIEYYYFLLVTVLAFFALTAGELVTSFKDFRLAHPRSSFEEIAASKIIS